MSIRQWQLKNIQEAHVSPPTPSLEVLELSRTFRRDAVCVLSCSWAWEIVLVCGALGW